MEIDDDKLLLDLQSYPMCPNPIIEFHIVLPPRHIPCPVKFFDNDTFGLPYFRSLPENHPIGRQLPDIARRNQWVLGIGCEEPIHAASASEELTRLLLRPKQDDIKLILSS